MTAKELLKILNEASDTAEIKIENGEITITEPTPVEYKFKVGDKVNITVPNIYPEGEIFEIVGLKQHNGEPEYQIKHNLFVFRAYERHLKLAPKDITDRIKSFEDACKWCVENGKREMLRTYSLIFNGLLNSESEITEDVDDIIAYLKLRIITCALNEGWEPTFENGEYWYRVFYDTYCERCEVASNNVCLSTALELHFKTVALAEYAAAQFADVYTDFFGVKKGGQQ